MFKDGSTQLIKLFALKVSHQLEYAECAVSQNLQLKPAFNWWVKATHKQRERIIKQVKKRKAARYLKNNEMFGIRLPKNAEEAKTIDTINGNTMWQDAIAKEMKDVRPAFEILPNGQRAQRDYQYVHCHMIFTIKMEDFRRKARLVGGGHMTEAPAAVTYASVVSRETVRIALLIAALNDLEVGN